MSLCTRVARPESLPMRFVSSKMSWMDVAIASMFFHVDTKYCEICSPLNVSIPFRSSRTLKTQTFAANYIYICEYLYMLIFIDVDPCR